MKSFSTKILLTVVAFVLQLASSQFSMRVAGRIETLDIGVITAFLTLISILFGAASGIVVGLILIQPDKEYTARKQSKILTTLVLGSLPILGVTASLIYSALGPQVFPFSFLRPGTLEFSWWAFSSQLPAFWLGLVAIWGIRRAG